MTEFVGFWYLFSMIFILGAVFLYALSEPKKNVNSIINLLQPPAFE